MSGHQVPVQTEEDKIAAAAAKKALLLNQRIGVAMKLCILTGLAGVAVLVWAAAWRLLWQS